MWINGAYHRRLQFVAVFYEICALKVTGYFFWNFFLLVSIAAQPKTLCWR